MHSLENNYKVNTLLPLGYTQCNHCLGQEIRLSAPWGLTLVHSESSPPRTPLDNLSPMFWDDNGSLISL